MPTIEIAVENKIARQTNEEAYVCGNSDFVIVFAFDAEWGAYSAKTARLKYNGKYRDVVFTGNECPVPIISNANNIQIGVYAGDLHTTTPAVVMAKKSILCGDGVHDAPPEDVYNQIMEMLEQGVTDEQIEAVVEQYMAEHPQEGVTEEELKEAVDAALVAAKESGEFDGADGKDGYTPVKGVDYFDGVDGKDGQNGKDGQDGYTPIKGVDYFDGKDGYTPVKNVDYFDGKDGADGYTPVKGTDYWTAADKAEMVNDVLAALPAAEGVSV